MRNITRRTGDCGSAPDVMAKCRTNGVGAPRHPTYFLEHQSFLLRFSRSVPDSTAGLTFDPVSCSSSTGTQPRSVILQNQNNKAQRYGNESRQPVYEAQIHTPAWLSRLRTFTQVRICKSSQTSTYHMSLWELIMLALPLRC